ncbi:YezD family protein [Paenibacillus sp. CC-CFT747]|nr:YezD family protein [Paenibacillus sp. CC-CFT747]
MAKPLEIDDLCKSRIVKSLSGMEYGSVQIIVHEGRIVQIERTERKRFDAVSNSRQDVSGCTAGQ